MTTIVDCPKSRILDWNFHVFGVPVCVKIWFWIVILLIGGEQPPGAMGIWFAVCLVSILLHELGHVAAFRAYRSSAQVVLYGWGGMAIPDRDVAGSLRRVVVAGAGPLAGFCLAGLTVLAAWYSGAGIQFGFRMFLPVLAVASRSGALSLWHILLNDLLWVNFYWGLINLLPIYPFDGGHISQAIFERVDPWRGRGRWLVLSAAMAGVVAIFGILEHSLYMVLVFAMLAVTSLQLRDGSAGRPAYRSGR